MRHLRSKLPSYVWIISNSLMSHSTTCKINAAVTESGADSTKTHQTSEALHIALYKLLLSLFYRSRSAHALRQKSRHSNVNYLVIVQTSSACRDLLLIQQLNKHQFSASGACLHYYQLFYRTVLRQAKAGNCNLP